MNIISATAKANIRQNKSRNILIAVAIILTSILLTSVPIAGLGMYTPRMAAANKILPTFHAMYRGVSQAGLDEMKADAEYESVGSRIDLGQMVSEDATIIMSAYDAEGIKLNKMELQEGATPKREDEIVVSKDILQVMESDAGIGDKIKIPYQIYEKTGLGFALEKEFIISGFVKSGGNNENKIYGALVSESFVRESIKSGEREYRTYIRIGNSEKLTTDNIENKAVSIAEEYGVIEDDVVTNGEYLMANYVDPGLYSGIAVIMIIIILAAVMTIYSIYYVSLMNKIQEYGKLKAMGATKKQIKSIVFREGFSVACIAIPVGVIIGSLLGYGIVYAMCVNMKSDNILSKTITTLVRQREVVIVQPWIVVLALVTAFATVYVSLQRPMKIASRFSAIEAIRCHSTQSEKKKRRKGFENITLFKLALSNLSRNRKRSIITILTLGIISILFMTVATVLSCMRPEDRAKQDVRAEFELSIEFESGNKMSPEKELHRIQMSNPLNDTLKKELEQLEGVKQVEPMLTTVAEVEELTDGDEPYRAYVTGVQEQNIAEIETRIVEGSVDKQKLNDGSGVIMSKGYMEKFMNVKVGDTYTIHIKDGEKVIPHKITVMASTDAPRSTYGDGGFVMSAKGLQGLCQTDLTGQYSIAVSKSALKKVDQVLKEKTDADSRLSYASYKEAFNTSKQAIEMMLNMGYAFLVVLGIVGMLNLINTMINSVHVRKKELGTLQAIGLSDKQMIRMLQIEGLFYTAGTLFLGLGVGNFAGYLCFQYAKDTHMMDIQAYHYPLLPTVGLVLAVLGVQLFVGYVVNKNFQKESLIERVRFSE